MNDLPSGSRGETEVERVSRKRLLLLKESIAIDLQKTKELVQSWKTDARSTPEHLECINRYIESTEQWLLMLHTQLEKTKKPYCEGCESGHPGQLAHYGGCLPDPFGLDSMPPFPLPLPRKN